jgi:hypothetical protein
MKTLVLLLVPAAMMAQTATDAKSGALKSARLLFDAA